MAKKNTRSDKPTSGTTQPVPERRRTARATTRTAATPDVVIAEPNGSPELIRDTAHDLVSQGAEDGRPAPTFEEIAEAAYHRYIQRGGQHGYDFDDWLDAERSLRSRQ